MDDEDDKTPARVHCAEVVASCRCGAELAPVRLNEGEHRDRDGYGPGETPFRLALRLSCPTCGRVVEVRADVLVATNAPDRAKGG